MKTYDAIVVGAGPAGSTAALRMSQKGMNVLLVERGESPGAKNMFGGMIPNVPIAEEVIPGFWEQAPWERHVVKRTLTIISGTSSTSIDFESKNFDKQPYNGYTIFRPVFDKWYAGKAREAGAMLLTGCLVKDLIKGKNGSIIGVSIDKEKGEARAPVTVICDGVLSLLAKKAGLYKQPSAGDMALGIKALFGLREKVINERFGLVRRQGLTQEFLGCTEGIRGGGFLYTQTDTISAGLVFHLDSLRAHGIAPYDIFGRFLSLDPLKRALKGAELMEYSAHVLPEGGYKLIPRLFSNGILLAGDSAALCYTNGLNQEGMNLAITSGFLAAETVLDAHKKADFSARKLADYKERLDNSFILRDMKTFRKMPELMHNNRIFSTYPELVGAIMEEMYTFNGKPKKSFVKTAWDEVKRNVRLKHLLTDVLKGGWSIK